MILVPAIRNEAVKVSSQSLGVKGLALGGRRRRLGAISVDTVIQKIEAGFMLQAVGVNEEFLDLAGKQFTLCGIRLALDDAGEGNLETSR